MSCTDPEFAESMRPKPREEVRMDVQSPWAAEELTATTESMLALKALADAIASATHAQRVNADVDRRHAFNLALAEASARAESLNPDGMSGVWVGLGMPFRYGRPRAAVCFDCGWVGRVRSADFALAEALAHHC